MSTANKTPIAKQPDQDGSSNAGSRRNQVMVGDLPEDFLRSNQQQMQVDPRVAQVQQAQQQAGFLQLLPTNVHGRLSVTIVQARLNKNYGLSKMDPYCRVRAGHTVFETPTAVNGGKNPQWNRTVLLYLDVGVETMYLEIFDERSFTVDDRVAWTVITIPQTVMSGETSNEWHNLSGRLGDGQEGSVNIVMSLMPASRLSHVSYFSSYTTPMVMPMHFPAPVVGHPVVPPMAYPPQPGMPGMPAMPAQQLRQQPPPQMTEEDLKQVKDMFPSMEDEVIKSVFEANRGNKDATINCLLTMASE